MAHKRLRLVSPCQATTSPEIVLSPTDRSSENSFHLPAAQAAFLARLGLDATRARLTAELAWGRS